MIQSFRDFDKSVLIALFTLKLLGTFALQALFTYYYTDRSTADIYRFFDDGLILRDVLFTNPSHFLRILFGSG